MKAKEIKFTGANGVSLPGIIWYPLCSPTMVVQITHGMTEHIILHHKQIHSDIFLYSQRPPKIERLANLEPVGRCKIPLN